MLSVSADCLGCSLANGRMPAEIVYENEYVTCLLDIAPIHEGHMLILPKSHVLDLDEMDENTAAAVMMASAVLSRLLKRTFAPDGITVMQNGGAFNDLKHYHMHVFPRYKQDGFAWVEPADTHYAGQRLAETRRKLKGLLKNGEGIH
ncbi:HIT family protein [Paenibacillus piri]|uniref:HIT family protein n=1 Tax=Paenibacillus piri TaxID=2547395 RepID=A0A4R5KW75_9BACL|nr:HIT family protein [Paenibacillus piri]TDF99762.1 HIT family protein [Paenibacillus piri]